MIKWASKYVIYSRMVGLKFDDRSPTVALLRLQIGRFSDFVAEYGFKLFDTLKVNKNRVL